jgi:hypothetical protein
MSSMTTLRCLPGVLSQFQQIYRYLCLTCIFWLREEGIQIEGNVKVLSFENVKITYYYQSVAPDGPSMPPPKKETCAGGKRRGRQSVVPVVRLVMVVPGR